MYDIITIGLLYTFALFAFVLGASVINKNKKQIVNSLLVIATIIVVAIVAYYIDSNSSPQELVKKVERMYSGHSRTYLEAHKRQDKTRMLNGWVIDKLAYNYLVKAVNMDPSYDQARIKLCENYVYEKNYSKAIKWANTVSSVSSGNNWILELEAVAYLRLGEKDQAYERYNILKAKNAVSDNLEIVFLFDGLK